MIAVARAPAVGPWGGFGLTSIPVFLVGLDATVLFAAFGAIRRSFPAASSADLSWVLNAYTIVYAALLVPAGRLADMLGHKRIFLLGAFLFGLSDGVAAGTVDDRRRRGAGSAIARGRGGFGLAPNRFGVNTAIRLMGSVFGVALTVLLVGGIEPQLTRFQTLYLCLVAGGLVTAVLCLPVRTAPWRGKAVQGA